MKFTRAQRLAAELVGTALLLATVVGSGIMADQLAGGNVAIALLGNSIATGAMLVVLITMLGPVSGAHFNPAVTLVFVLRRDMPMRIGVSYMLCQVVGGLSGVWIAHTMFGEAVIQFSSTIRTGEAQWFAEAIATFGLIITILATLRFQQQAVAMSVGLYVTAAYWFTASTSFANPAVTIARGLSNTFVGIRLQDVPPFIAAQLVGALIAWVYCRWQLTEPAEQIQNP